MGLDSGKHGVAYGRHDSRRDNYQSDYSDVSMSSARSDNLSAKGNHKSVRFSEPAASQLAALSELEKKLSSMQKDFAQQLRSISEKETEKFDLIFAILTDLQSGQAQLEESIRDIKKHASNAQMVCVPQMAPQHQQHGEGQQQQPHQGQFNGNNGGNQFQAFGQMDGVMGAQMGQEMGAQQPMQQIVMQPDGSQAVLVAMPQVMILQSPTGGVIVPQMMPAGGQMQPMQPQMAVQFVGQGPTGQDLGNFANAQAMEQHMDGSDAMGPQLADSGKHEGSDIDSTDTPTTAFSE